MMKHSDNYRLDPYWSRTHCGLKSRHDAKHVLLATTVNMEANIVFCNMMAPCLQILLSPEVVYGGGGGRFWTVENLPGDFLTQALLQLHISVHRCAILRVCRWFRVQG